MHLRAKSRRQRDPTFGKVRDPLRPRKGGIDVNGCDSTAVPADVPGWRIAASSAGNPSVRGSQNVTSREPRPPGSVILTRQEDVWVLALRGEHDFATVRLLEDQMGRIGVPGAKVAIDATRATFIDCRVVGWLLHWSQRARDSDQFHLAVATGHSGSVTNRLLALLTRLDLAETIATVATATEALDSLRRLDPPRQEKPLPRACFLRRPRVILPPLLIAPSVRVRGSRGG
jgi:hypothetical protein